MAASSPGAVVVWDTGGGPGLAASGSPRARIPLRPLVLAGGGGGKEAARAGAESEQFGFTTRIFYFVCENSVFLPQNSK